mgnify:CR=1 FL=1
MNYDIFLEGDCSNPNCKNKFRIEFSKHECSELSIDEKWLLMKLS